MASPQPALEWSAVDDLAVNTIRILAADMVQAANSGHPGMPMGFALPAHLLFTRHLRFNPDNPFWPGRDRFVLSAGHGSALQYVLLHLAGYELPMEELKQFRQFGSRTPGHPEFGHTAGVETTTGPLGQGLSNAVGMALAREYISSRLPGGGFDPLDHYVYAIASDGDLQEGLSGEASSFAAHQQLGRLIVLYDDNQISIDGSTDLSWSEDVTQRYQGYGWQVLDADGTDPESVQAALIEAKAEAEKPTLIRTRTHIGHGSPNKQDSADAHGSPLGEEELAAVKRGFGWELEPFEVPEEVYALYAARADEGRAAHELWLPSLEEWKGADEQAGPLWESLVHGAWIGEGLDAAPEFSTEKPVATRAAFGKALNAMAASQPRVIGGSADLTGSNKTNFTESGPFLPESRAGRNLHFGVREHAMGAIANGMALYGGLRPYTGTFLVFSDYMRPAIRLAALMKLPVSFVFSHDSIGVGEDGPTHQPIEHYAALRAIPNLDTFRPGDAAETAVALRCALEREDGPTAVLTTRQGLRVIDREQYAAVGGAARGGYVLADCEGEPELILIGTGSELELVLGAWERLERVGVKVRVVSMPCTELFERQDRSYRDEVLPPQVTRRLAVEAGIALGWERFVGSQGAVHSLEHYGASAPGKRLFEEFGFTIDAVIEAAKRVLDDEQ